MSFLEDTPGFVTCFSMSSKNFGNKKQPSLSLHKLLPNIFTTIGMCSGLTGIRFALENEWNYAVLCILVAACFDMIDGLSARLLRAFSRFGAELDSLADAISFGVAPTLITYLWVRDAHYGDNSNYLLGWYWIPFLFYSACSVFRLARFNVMDQQDIDSRLYKKSYFTGVPAPAAAGLVLMPMGLQFIFQRFGIDFSIPEQTLWLVAWVSIVALSMISRIPTFSLRNMRFNISKAKALPVLIIVCLAVAVFMKEVWISLFTVGILYILSIPFSFWACRNDLRKLKN